MISHRLAGVLLFSLASIVGCNSSTVMEVMDYERLVDGLREAGATVEEAGETELPGAGTPIFSVTSKITSVNEENIWMLEFSDEATAKAEAKFVSPDGFNLSGPGIGVHVDWIAPPHWYNKGRIIVLYVGRNQATIDLLENLLGEQFAGG
ncbi:MAG: hypothetical protein Q8O55_03460 [Dehalococcoidales bacterium]|nr:hypothetical protein [Dehalococcoidales bacterium]